MAGLSFSVFKDKILSGAKRQTIRKERKNPIKEGETLYLWWKMRTPQREKLGEATCLWVKPVKITDHAIHCDFHIDSLEQFAVADGFDSWNDLVKFFETTHGLPFEGVLIKWGELRLALEDENIDCDYQCRYDRM